MEEFFADGGPCSLNTDMPIPTFDDNARPLTSELDDGERLTHSPTAAAVGASNTSSTPEPLPKSPATIKKKRKSGCVTTAARISRVSRPTSRKVGDCPGLPVLQRRFNLQDPISLEIVNLAENFLRPDLTNYLREALPRWKESGLWLQEQLPEPLVSGPGSAKLFRAYHYICRLEDRIGDDQVRNRVAAALLHTGYEQACLEWRRFQHANRRQQKGRGDASAVIDNILAEVHEDWKDPRMRKFLRSRFHDKKRYGKRWLTVGKSLGESTLIACSGRVASMM
jgi:hypothetical protein